MNIISHRCYNYVIFHDSSTATASYQVTLLASIIKLSIGSSWHLELGNHCAGWQTANKNKEKLMVHDLFGYGQRAFELIY